MLSLNDCGLGRGHQAGILIPKEIGGVIFREIEPTVKNPKLSLFLSPFGLGEDLSAVITHYNSKKFGGTRDEFRLTRITGFLKETELEPGDKLEIEFSSVTFNGKITFTRQKGSNVD